MTVESEVVLGGELGDLFVEMNLKTANCLSTLQFLYKELLAKDEVVEGSFQNGAELVFLAHFII